MACKYCKEDEPLHDLKPELSHKGEFYPGISVTVDGDRLYVTAIADTYEPSFQEVEVGINFCPMCGERLSKEG